MKKSLGVHERRATLAADCDPKMGALPARSLGIFRKILIRKYKYISIIYSIKQRKPVVYTTGFLCF
jgi:hypothetical protein